MALLDRNTALTQNCTNGRHGCVQPVLILVVVSNQRDPPHLGWYDTGLTYHTRITAIGVSGRRYPVPPQIFGPYTAAFTMNGFGYLVDDYNIVTAPYGITTSADIALEIFDAQSDEDIFALQTRWPDRSIHDPQRAANFYAFLQRYLTNLNTNGPRLERWASLGAPRQYWALRGAQDYAGQEPIQSLDVTAVTYFYDGEELRLIRSVLLRPISISQPATAVTE